MGRDVIERIFQVHPLVGGRMLCDAYARPPFLGRAYWPGYESAAAIRADIVEFLLGAIGAEGALVAANARLRRMRRQVLVAIFAVRPKLQRHRIVSAGREAASQIGRDFRTANIPRFRTPRFRPL